jgi:membrane complex biogenesis BtpA family protein
VIGPLVGVVHLGPLPGSPGFRGDLPGLVAGAVADAGALAGAGFHAVIVENYGDAPFFATDVPPITVAAMTRAVLAVAEAVDVPVGVNVLRNDAVAAVSIAAATGSAFVRVNVLSGVMYTDQGPIVGRAAEIARVRAGLGAAVEILADVFVKHAAPPAGLAITEAAANTWERAGADALVVSGSGTGSVTDPADLRTVAATVPDAPLFVGSGATPETVAGLLEIADGVIVGTAVKVDGVTTNPVDPERAAAFVVAAGA